MLVGLGTVCLSPHDWWEVMLLRTLNGKRWKRWKNLLIISLRWVVRLSGVPLPVPQDDKLDVTSFRKSFLGSCILWDMQPALAICPTILHLAQCILYSLLLMFVHFAFFLLMTPPPSFFSIDSIDSLSCVSFLFLSQFFEVHLLQLNWRGHQKESQYNCFLLGVSLINF